jgi:hypothetical protein
MASPTALTTDLPDLRATRMNRGIRVKVSSIPTTRHEASSGPHSRQRRAGLSGLPL